MRFTGWRNKLHVIYNGVDSEVFHPGWPMNSGRSPRAASSIPDEAPLLLFVGSGFERKGVPQLPGRGACENGCAIVIVGADRKLKAMQRLSEQLGVNPRAFTGPLGCSPVVRRGRRFRAADLVRPLPECGAGGLASGLPIVTSTTCGAQEWVRAGVNGWVWSMPSISMVLAQRGRSAGLAGDAGPMAAAQQVAERI